MIKKHWAPVAQLDRALGYGPGGSGFDSSQARQIDNMSKRYSGKSFKDSSVMKKAKLSFKEKRKLKRAKKKKWILIGLLKLP